MNWNVSTRFFFKQRIFQFSHSVATWKVSKYGVFSGPYFPAFGLNTERYGISPYSVRMRENTDQKKRRIFGHLTHCVAQLFNELRLKCYSNLSEVYFVYLCSFLRLGLLIRWSIFIIIFIFIAINHMISLKLPHLFICTFLTKVQPQVVA